MLKEAFIICALMLPGVHFNHRSIISYHAARSEQERLEAWIRKNNPDCEVFIHPNPREDKLKENFWERVPITWRGNQIWIKRKPDYDKKAIGASA